MKNNSDKMQRIMNKHYPIILHLIPPSYDNWLKTDLYFSNNNKINNVVHLVQWGIQMLRIKRRKNKTRQMFGSY